MSDGGEKEGRGIEKGRHAKQVLNTFFKLVICVCVYVCKY